MKNKKLIKYLIVIFALISAILKSFDISIADQLILLALIMTLDYGILSFFDLTFTNKIAKKMFARGRVTLYFTIFLSLFGGYYYLCLICGIMIISASILIEKYRFNKSHSSFIR